MPDRRPPVSEHVAAVVAWIKNGEFDEGDDLGHVMDAIRFQLETGAVAFGWRLKIDGHTLDEDDLMHGAWEDVEKELGSSWLLFTPTPSTTPATRARRIGALMRAVYHHHLGLTREEAAEKVRTTRSADLIAALEEVQVIDPPKD
jgi:hypothetical protein